MHHRALGIALIFFAAAAPGCKRTTAKADPASTHEVAAPVPAPEGLLADLIVPHPDRTWEAARATLGNMPLVPASPAIFLGDVLDLPVSVLEQIDLIVPIVGAIAETPLAMVAGIHVKDGPRFVELATATGGRFTKGETSDGLTLITPTASHAAWAYGVSGNYLLIAQEPGALRRLAPYVTRTLPGRPIPTENIVASASRKSLAGPTSARLKKLWSDWKQDRESEDVAMRAKHGGSTPDFGDPAQALADIDAKAEKFFAVLGDLDEARLALVIEPKSPSSAASYRALLTMKPGSESGPAGQEIASMPIAGAEPLLSLPSSVAVGLLSRDSPELRKEASTTQIDSISKVLGGRLEADDKKKIEAAFDSWSKGRGDWLTAGLVWAGPTRAAVLRGAVADPAELGRGATAMLRLLDVRAIADPLSSWFGDLKLSGLAPPGAGEGAVQSVHVVRRPPKVQVRRPKEKPAENDTFDIVWSIGKDLFFGAAGPDAKGAHAALLKGDLGKTLAQDAFVARTVERLGPNVSFALVVDPSRLTDATAVSADASALFFAYGKDRRNQAWFELDAPASAVLGYGALLGGMR